MDYLRLDILYYRRIKLGLPPEVKRTLIEDISILAPNETVVLPLEMLVSGLTGLCYLTYLSVCLLILLFFFIIGSPVRFDVRCDRGTYSGSLLLDIWDAITPTVMTMEMFETCKKSLRGFSESTTLGCKILTKVNNSLQPDTIGIAVRKMRTLVDMYVIQNEDHTEKTARLSGLCCIRTAKSGPLKEYQVLVTLSPDR